VLAVVIGAEGDVVATVSRRALVVLALLVVAGCGRLPVGVDGDLTGGWAAMPELAQLVPTAGACLDNEYKERVGLRLSDQPVDCSERHQLETIHVGSFDEADVADQDETPEPGTAQWRTAYEKCDAEDDEYLGADFRHGDLWLGVGVPQDLAWQAGARWFRCDLIEAETYAESPSSDTLRGSLAEEADARPGLVLGCLTVELEESGGAFDPIEFTDLVTCTEPHDAEFVGAWHRDRRDYPEEDDDWTTVHAGCLDLVADYVDVSRSYVSGVFRLSTIVEDMVQEDWDNGDRGFRCYLHARDEQLNRSLEGAGVDALESG